jgi:hypothetical protein
MNWIPVMAGDIGTVTAINGRAVEIKWAVYHSLPGDFSIYYEVADFEQYQNGVDMMLETL